MLLLNPWWQEEEISKDLAKPYKRDVFPKLRKMLDYRQILIISGLRRVGKSTLMFQLIEHLLNFHDPKKILYFTFDKRIEKIEQLLKAYKELTGINWKKEKIYFFLDEIAKLKNWSEKVKIFYDFFPNIKFVVSSSSSIGLEKEAISSLGGRYFLVNVKPLSFREYLQMMGKGRMMDNISLWEEDIEKEFEKYLLRSFPEIVEWKDENAIKDYLRTTIVDKILREDLPQKFKDVNQDLLLSLVEIFFSQPGMIANFDDLSKNLKISKKTLLKHMFFLEFSYLTKRVRNFRMSMLTSSRKLQKIYAYWWNLLFPFCEEKSRIMENFVCSILEAKHYWRKSGKEVDFLVKKGKEIIPVEVKIGKFITKAEIGGIISFMKKYAGRGIVAYYGGEKVEKINGKHIEFLPFWKLASTSSPP